MFDLNGRVCNISEKLYKKCFSTSIGANGISSIRELDILKMIPLIGGYFKQLA